jgi:predicted acylesterase/phospholipase RssA
MGSTQSETSKESNDCGFVKYDSGDVTYFGASEIVAEEREHILRRRAFLDLDQQGDDIKNTLTGLALSGGGIRSASFCLGILQALSYRNVLKKIDYLSTVSGGGYIGSSLTWLLSKTWYKKADKKIDVDKPGQAAQKIPFDVDRKNFPYGTYPMIGQVSEAGEKQSSFDESAKELKHRGALLRYLRQHGKYLTPGHGINGFSLLGVVLRGSILSIFVYFSVLVLLMTALDYLGAFSSLSYEGENPALTVLSKVPNYSIMLGLTGLVLFVLAAPLYSFIAYRQSKRKNGGNITEEKTAKLEKKSYLLRRRCEILYNYLLLAVSILIVVGLIPVVYVSLNQGSGILPGIIGAISTAIGFISSISAYIKTSSNKKGIIPISLLVLVGTIALWFGLLILAYHCSLIIGGNPVAVAILAGLAIFIGWKANLNYISVHRYYRDRLMETFMPDVPEVLDPAATPQHATAEADKARLSKMCGYKGEDEHLYSPYHIINTNLVLVSSKIAKFKGRGGDNFILSPAYCGSNATGWQKTNKFMRNRMTLPTAMAISGAAVNPSTGVGGDGMTRQPFLSMLMGFLNIRLGYWATHPNPDYQSSSLDIPNFFRPGFFEMFFRGALKEDSRFLQLSDGGHFENLGIYELVRRKANIIISCDGAADPNYEFADLSNALEKIRADFGVLIDIPTHQLEAMVPKKSNALDKTEFAKRGFIVADIIYPDRKPGVFIYIKSTYFSALSADLYGYKQTHSEFPDEPTSDQFFDEKQFEAYRELGYQTVWQMMSHGRIRANSTLKQLFEIE